MCPDQGLGQDGCNFLVTCANSLKITEEVVWDFPDGIRYCTRAATSPFVSEEAKEIFDGRGIIHTLESFNSAKIIVADSMEVGFSILSY